MIASLLIPGLGQVGQGRWAVGLLFLALSLWLRLVLASYGWILTPDHDAMTVALVGCFALPDPFSAPLSLVVTLLAGVAHVWSAWDARRWTALT